MADLIYVNHERVEEDAARVESAAAYLRSVLLAPQDTRTTLFVNERSKTAYERSQDRISQLGLLLDQESQNIRDLGAAFVEFDEMMGRLGGNADRYCVMEAKE